MKKLYNITFKTNTPYFTYKKWKCVRPQLMWGSSLPNRFFLDLEITFSFAYSFCPYFHCFCPYCFTLSFTFFYPLQPLIHPPYFTVSSNRFIHQLLSVIYSMLVNVDYSVSSDSITRQSQSYIIYEELFHLPWFKKTNFSDNRRIR